MDESGQHYLGTALPLDDVDASDVDLVGRFAELLTRLRTVTAGWTESRSVAGWIADFSRAIELLTAVPASDTWQLTHAHGQLSRIAEAAGDDSGMLSLPEVAALLTDAFRGRASRANFRTGTLTMCTMLPMRSVPHRVVCLLGSRRRRLPAAGPARRRRHRRARPDGRRPGSAQRGPAAAAGRAAGRRGAAGGDHRRRRPAHRQPTSRPRCRSARCWMPWTRRRVRRTDDAFASRSPSAIPCSRSPRSTSRRASWARPDGFSFDRASLRGVRAASVARPSRRRRPSFASTPCRRRRRPRLLGLAELIRFFNHPPRALLRERGRLSLWADDEEPDEQIPAELAGLERWQVGERLLRLHLQGEDLAVLAAAEWRRGTLPPRGFGARALTEVADEVAGLAALAAPFRTGAGRAPGDRARPAAAQPSRPADRVGRPALRRSPGPGQLLGPQRQAPTAELDRAAGAHRDRPGTRRGGRSPWAGVGSRSSAR